jgi:pyruvate dehydrogenase E1 component alpha subunit
MRSLVAEHFGKATGSCNGIGFINTCAPELGMFGMGGTVGGESTLAAGTALAAQFRGKRQVVLCFLGDGALGEGSVHTALLMSANWKLPGVWVCSNNGMSMWVPVSAAYPKENVADLAFGYDIPSTIEDGQDVAAVYSAVHAAVERARSGQGPSFIEFKTCRYGPQVEGVADYSLDGLRDPAEVERWKQRDPIRLCACRLLEEGILGRTDLDRIDREALRAHLVQRRQFILQLLENPNLMEHDRFTDLLWAVLHVEEELQARADLSELSAADEAHLRVDIRRAYNALLSEWILYAEHLKNDYPYLFSLVVRTHPFQEAPSAVVTE